MLWGINVDVNSDLLATCFNPCTVMNYVFVIHHITKAELFNSFNRNNNRPDEAEDVQHGSDHSLDSDDNGPFARPSHMVQNYIYW